MFYDESGLTFLDICTKADVKAAMKPTFDNEATTYDTLIDRYIQAAQREMESALGFGIYNLYECLGETAYADGTGYDFIQLPVCQIVSIGHLYDDINRVYSADTEIDADNFLIQPRGIIRLLNGLTFNKDFKNIKIDDYNCGWLSSIFSNEEAVLKDICIRAVTRKLNKRLNLGLDTHTTPDGAISVFDSNDFTEEEINYLRSRRLTGFY